jgi:ABC-type Zn uptake system ZnuABC Zn-binding protein ZnuA
MKRLAFFPLLLLLPFAALACGGDGEDNGSPGSTASGDRIQVIATTTQIGDFARQVGGDRIDLTVLVKPNQDVHDFELEPSQLRAIAGADVVLRHGLGLDGFLDKAVEGSKASVVSVTDGITTQEGSEHHHEGEGEDEEEHDEDGEHAADPHVWFSADNASRMVENIRHGLAAKDGENASTYRDKAAAYLERLDTLDNEIRTEVETIPESCRKLVTNHDVLGYYATAYGFEIIGSVIPSTSSEAQASAADVSGIVGQIRAQGVPAIFAEASINPDLSHQVGREAGVTVVDDLYGDSLGDPNTDGGTYIDMMRTDTEKIVDALKNCQS